MLLAKKLSQEKHSVYTPKIDGAEMNDLLEKSKILNFLQAG